VKYGETMNFSLDKQMERVVEVLALSALMANNPTEKVIVDGRWISVKKRLEEFAFPLGIEL